MVGRGMRRSGERWVAGGYDKNRRAGRGWLLGLWLVCTLVSLLVWLGSRNGKVRVSNIEELLPKQVQRIDKQVVLRANDDGRVAVVERLQRKVATASGEWAVWVQPLAGEGYGFNQDAEMEGASIMKVLAMLYVWREIESGNLLASDSVKLREVDRSPGSGPLVFLPEGTAVSWQRILWEMGKKSDNTGWRITNRVLGAEKIAGLGGEIGLADTNYRELVYTTTARDVTKLFLRVSEQSEEFKDLLRGSIYEDRIPAGVPVGVDVVHKVGTLGGVWADAGIVSCKGGDTCRAKPFVLAILNKGVEVEEAARIFPELVKIVWEYENR